MHLIIPYASSLSEGCQAAQQSLRLLQLQQLLKRLSPLPAEPGDAWSLSTPCERALARALQLPNADGQIPWAALHARQLTPRTGTPAPSAETLHQPSTGLTDPADAWAFISLCHWQVNTHHVAMSQLPLPDLTAAESDALLAAMRPYFAEDGITLHADQPGRWLAQSARFADIASASIDRVVGRNLAAWMPEGKAAAPLRRLQNEMQMLLYTHPVNDAREARGLLPINSFWLSGSGRLPADYILPTASSQPQVADSLRAHALSENWPAWTQAWHALEASHIQPLLQALAHGEAVQLTLCGERSSQRWISGQGGLWKKMAGLFANPSVIDLLRLAEAAETSPPS